MNIRNATYKDAPSIKLLLEALGYKTSTILLISQLEKLFGGKDHQAFVYELDNEVVGLIAVHYLPQLGFVGELVTISCLSVDESAQLGSIGKELEEYVTAPSRQKKM